jgi:membrane associated rhomboid family serine protease
MTQRHYDRDYRSVWLLAALTIVCSVAAWSPQSGPRAFRALMLSPEEVRSGEVWRLVTYAFIAPATWCFLFKLLVLFYIAAPLEAVWGTKRFLTLFLISTVGAGLTGTIFYRPMAGGWAPMMSLMLIHGFLFPDSMIYAFFIFPMRVKTLAMIGAAVYLAVCMRMGFTGLALFLGTLSGVLYYMAVTRSIPWVRRTRRRIVQAVADPGALVKGASTAKIMDRARKIMRRVDSGEALADPDRAFIEELVQRTDPTHELCSPYSFSPDNTICPPCREFGRCLRRYLEER